MINILSEFNNQIANLIQKGYPKLANISEQEFEASVRNLENKLEGLHLNDIDFDNGYIPFVLVVKNKLIPIEKSFPLVDKNGKPGEIKLYPYAPNDFVYTRDVNIPDSSIYLLISINRGKDSLNLTPNEAMTVIEKKRQTPLTIDEGVAIVTHYPDFLIKNNCFSLLASRKANDKRVPAIWINSTKNANLGWCWEGNPHTWLGSASAQSRIGY